MKLKPNNLKKYCMNCKEIVKIKMIGLDGFCPNKNCGKRLFTLNPKTKSNIIPHPLKDGVS